MVRFQFMRMSSYAKNKVQMCSVTQHHCRRSQMCGIFSQIHPEHSLFVWYKKRLVLTEQSIHVRFQLILSIRGHPHELKPYHSEDKSFFVRDWVYWVILWNIFPHLATYNDIGWLNTSIKSSIPKSMQPSIPPIGQRLSFSMSQVDLTHIDDYVVTIVNIINITIIVNAVMIIITVVKSTCDIENDKRCPMGGIDGCILLGNELLHL